MEFTTKMANFRLEFLDDYNDDDDDDDDNSGIGKTSPSVTEYRGPTIFPRGLLSGK